MNKTLLSTFIALMSITALLLTNNNAHSNGGGAPAGYTGSSLEFNNRTCSSANGGCHGGGGVSFQTGLVTSTIPDCGYIGGQTYTMTVYVTSPNRTKFGFSISPQLSNGNTAGTIVASVGTQLNGSGRYLTHTLAGTAQTGANERTWVFQWTAPSTGSGTVIFYAAVNATNSNNANSGDLIFNSTLTVDEGSLPEAPVISGANSFCFDSSITLSTNYTEGIIWQPSGLAAQTLTVNEPGTYTANYTSACGSVSSFPFEVTLAVSPEPPIITLNSFGNLQSSIVGIYSYNWYLNNELTSTTDSASFSPQLPGDYTLVLTSPTGCSSTQSLPFTVSGVSILPVFTHELSIFPNPNNGIFTIHLQGTQQSVKIWLRDVYGKIIQELNLTNDISLIHLSEKKGIYFLEFRNKLYKILVTE